MPIYRLACANSVCEQYRVVGRKMLRAGELDRWLDENPCDCGERLEREPSGPGVDALERLDNGAMPRAVERRRDVVRLMHEHVRHVKGEKT